MDSTPSPMDCTPDQTDPVCSVESYTQEPASNVDVHSNGIPCHLYDAQLVPYNQEVLAKNEPMLFPTPSCDESMEHAVCFLPHVNFSYRHRLHHTSTGKANSQNASRKLFTATNYPASRGNNLNTHASFSKHPCRTAPRHQACVPPQCARERRRASPALWRTQRGLDSLTLLRGSRWTQKRRSLIA